MGNENNFGHGEAQFVTGDVPKVKNYIDATYNYTCIAQPGTSLTDAKWRIFRTRIATVGENTAGDITHVDNSRFSQLATSTAVVAALTYS